MFASTEPAAVRDAALQADRIGARLVRDAVRDGRRAAWLGDQMELVNNQWAAALKPTGPDLCAGTPGIAMFLARLHKFTGERLFRLTADAAFGHAVSQLESIPAEVRGSLWSGWAGISWALLDAGVRSTMPSGPNADSSSQDVLRGSINSGVAGCHDRQRRRAAFLLQVHRRFGKQEAR